MKKEPAVHRVSVLLTKTQFDTIKKAADSAGLGLSAYTRQAALKEASQ